MSGLNGQFNARLQTFERTLDKTIEEKLVSIGRVKGGGSISFELPNEFFISRVDTPRMFHLYKIGEQYTSGICYVSATNWECVYIQKSGNNTNVYLKLYEMSAASGASLKVTNYASDLEFFGVGK